MKPIIAIIGNTGVGKSQFSIDLAKQLNGEIINGDAMQMYKDLDIITNKHPINEREGVPHYLLGTENWDTSLTVQDFESKANSKINEIHNAGKLPILVGGTNYYLQAVLCKNSTISHYPTTTDTNVSTPTDTGALYKFTESQLQILEDPKKVEEQLQIVDPLIFNKFHPNDTRRLRRALEIYYETGTPPTTIYKQQQAQDSEHSMELRYPVLVVWVYCNREVLVNRLDQRVDKMVELGLINEIKELYATYDSSKHNSGIYQVIGFRQFLPYLDNISGGAGGDDDSSVSHDTSTDFQNGVQSMKTETRQYAKKQTRWIKNKLSPLLTKLGGSLAVLDSSDLSQWQETVSQPGIQHVQRWLNENTPPHFNYVPSHLQSEVSKSTNEFNEEQWVRFRCDVCSSVRDTEIVLIGKDQYNKHLQSSRHKSINRKTQSGSRVPT